MAQEVIYSESTYTSGTPVKGCCYEFWRSQKPEVRIEISSRIPNSNRLIPEKIFYSAHFPALQDGGPAHVGYKQGLPSTVVVKPKYGSTLFQWWRRPKMVYKVFCSLSLWGDNSRIST